MPQSSYFDFEKASFTPPAPPTHTSEASETQSSTQISSRIQTSITTVSKTVSKTVSNSPRELPLEPTIPGFPLYDCFPRELKCEVMYQAALESTPRMMPINIETRLRSPSTRLPSDRIDAFLQAGGKWKMQKGDFQYLTITRGYGWHALDELILEQFQFRPDKDVLWFSEVFLENYQNINIYPSDSVKRLVINLENFRELLTLYKGNFLLEPPKHSTLFIGKLKKLEHIYVVPACSAIKEILSEGLVLMEDHNELDTCTRDILLKLWFSWLEKESENIGWDPPSISFKRIRWT
ncbi:uncharacterized protein EAE97_000355 [Botrytis byssoidea]|uniref:Uncharacterized protein n=1 Tax=Botrytis byssoidea TaxID=139641 RepID=A0A9P5IV73_9HELO|nr:uncharacterized protein EAE97_000355 [Botrytis byssoidea]KAF7955096.1 hypothetical protein EAE97_000355 [Botrytis byssoidea]